MVSLYGNIDIKENIHLCAHFYGVNNNVIETRAYYLMEMMDIKNSKISM